MINNTKLKQSLKELAQSVFKLYDTCPAIIAIDKFDDEICKNRDYFDCIKLMEDDAQIKALQGKLVGTKKSTSLVENEQVCILSFLKQLYLKNPVYNQYVFDEQYSAFEDLFYSDFLEIEESTRLYNFQFSGNVIELAPGISILKKTPQEEHEIHKIKSYEMFSKSDFIIKREFIRKKVVSGWKGINRQVIDKGILDSYDLFDLVITSLRILKPSAVYRDLRIESEIMTFQPYVGVMTTFPFFENVAIGNKCIIEEDDFDELRIIVKYMINQGDSRYTVATRRLSLGMERRNLLDRIIDYMIGLEAMYLPDGNEELSFRLSLRAALLLYSDPVDRKQTYYFLRKMYKMRSNIVHGNKYALDKDEINKLEEILRISIKLWIKDNQNFSINGFSNSGKLKSEGKLDVLFFDT
ncbi:hypothetical protein ACFLU8_00485 [Chloroflexota bacterium]